MFAAKSLVITMLIFNSWPWNTISLAQLLRFRYFLVRLMNIYHWITIRKKPDFKENRNRIEFLTHLHGWKICHVACSSQGKWFNKFFMKINFDTSKVSRSKNKNKVGTYGVESSTVIHLTRVHGLNHKGQLDRFILHLTIETFIQSIIGNLCIAIRSNTTIPYSIWQLVSCFLLRLAFSSFRVCDYKTQRHNKNFV